MTLRKIAIICMIGIIACICGCLDNGDNYQYKLDQAIENRDAQWENAIRQSNDQQTLDFIMQILPLLI